MKLCMSYARSMTLELTLQSFNPTRDSYLVQRTGEIITRFVCANIAVFTRAGLNKDGDCLAGA